MTKAYVDFFGFQERIKSDAEKFNVPLLFHLLVSQKARFTASLAEDRKRVRDSPNCKFRTSLRLVARFGRASGNAASVLFQILIHFVGRFESLRSLHFLPTSNSSRQHFQIVLG
jgi:hypothetical protein